MNKYKQIANEEDYKTVSSIYFRLGMLVGVLLAAGCIAVTVLFAADPLCFG